MSTAAKLLKPAEIVEIFRRFEQVDPNPTTELEYGTGFQLLVAVVLSAQATDKSVNLATRNLFKVAPDAQAMVALGEDKIRQHIQTIGLYRNKAKNVFSLAQQLLAQHGGEVPHDRAALEALPGVGRKTANVVLNTLFGDITIAVNTHIFRVANRIGLAPGKDVVAVEQALYQRIPPQYQRHAHHWLILHGRYTCVARKPKCSECIIFDLCNYPDKNVYAHS